VIHVLGTLGPLISSQGECALACALMWSLDRHVCSVEDEDDARGQRNVATVILANRATRQLDWDAQLVFACAGV
jgi:hypothetical protein